MPVTSVARHLGNGLDVEDGGVGSMYSSTMSLSGEIPSKIDTSLIAKVVDQWRTHAARLLVHSSDFHGSGACVMRSATVRTHEMELAMTNSKHASQD